MAETAVEKPKPWSGMIVVEISDPRNRNHLLHLLKDLVRGRWERRNLIPDENVEELEAIPDMPGMAIEINTDPKSIRIYDPLATKQYAETMERARNHPRGKNTGPAKETIIKDPTDDDIKSWLYWAVYRLNEIPVSTTATGRPMSGPAIRVLEGRLPTLDEINKLPGKIRKGVYNTAAGFKADVAQAQHVSA